MISLPWPPPYWRAQRRAVPGWLLNARSLLLASGSKKIGQDSSGRFSDSDWRWMTMRWLGRFSAAPDTSKYPFRRSESFVSRGDCEVLIHISHRQIVWRNEIEPVILAREGREDRGLSRAVSGLCLDRKGSRLRSHSQARGKVPRFGNGDDLRLEP